MLSITTLLLVSLAFVNARPSEHEHLQHIPVPGYHPKLQLLGQHVDLPEVPTKIIKITKTVAIKVPVPYPVKIPHSVPYPVPVNKPYPVPVPQIIKVPHPVPVPIPSSGHHGLGQGNVHGGDDGHYQGQYSVEEQSHDLSSNGIGGGYANQYDHGYGESQHVVMPAIYQEHQQASPTSYHSQDISSYQGGPASLSYSIDHTQGSQGDYQLKAEASEQQPQKDAGIVHMYHNSRMYHVGDNPNQAAYTTYKHQGY